MIFGNSNLRVHCDTEGCGTALGIRNEGSQETAALVRSFGWRIVGDKTYCKGCVEAGKAPAEQDGQ